MGEGSRRFPVASRSRRRKEEDEYVGGRRCGNLRVACQRIGEHPKSGNKFLSPDRVGGSHMASLHAVVLVLSMYLISPGLRPICHAAIMQFRCIISAIRPGGYARAVQIECSHGAGRLIRLVQLGAFAAGRRAGACGSPGVWRLAGFCSARPDRPADPPGRRPCRRGHRPRPACVRPALVSPPTAPPGHRPMASPQRATHRCRNLTGGNRKEVTRVTEPGPPDLTEREAVP